MAAFWPYSHAHCFKAASIAFFGASFLIMVMMSAMGIFGRSCLPDSRSGIASMNRCLSAWLAWSM